MPYRNSDIAVHFGLVPTGDEPATLGGYGAEEDERVFAWTDARLYIHGTWTTWGEVPEEDADMHVVLYPDDSDLQDQVAAALMYFHSTIDDTTRIVDYAVISDRCVFSEQRGVVLLDSPDRVVLPKGVMA